MASVIYDGRHVRRFDPRSCSWVADPPRMVDGPRVPHRRAPIPLREPGAPEWQVRDARTNQLMWTVRAWTEDQAVEEMQRLCREAGYDPRWAWLAPK